VTGRRQGPKRKLRAGFTERRHKNRRYVAIIFHRGVWYRALSLRYACIRNSGIFLTPRLVGYLCAKFRFFRSIRCWASPLGKIAYSLNHSPSLFDIPRTEACATINNKWVNHI